MWRAIVSTVTGPVNFLPPKEVHHTAIMDANGNAVLRNADISNRTTPMEDDAFFDEDTSFQKNGDSNEEQESVYSKKKDSKKKKKKSKSKKEIDGGSSTESKRTDKSYETFSSKDAPIKSLPAITSDSMNNVTFVPDRYVAGDHDIAVNGSEADFAGLDSEMNLRSRSWSSQKPVSLEDVPLEDQIDFHNVRDAILVTNPSERRKKRLSTLSTSAKYEYEKRVGEHETYPGDCYSFMAIHSPIQNPFFFLFGFVVFVFQIMFLIYMILNKLDTNLGLNGEVDNPSDDFLANFIPANVTALVRATQITAVLCYCMFADSSLKDCAAAIEQFPRFDRANKDDRVWLGILSCVLRFCQGFMAILATFLLIVTTSDVIEIILNFAAVNFISTLDEVAFELAKWGKYGPALEKEAKSIESRPIPYCIYRKYKHVRYFMTVVPIAVVLICSAIAITVMQESERHWVTQTFRVQFQSRTGLQDYSGCYSLDEEISHNKRKNYNSFEANPEPAALGYCKETRQWKLFKNEGDGDGEGGIENDPCELTRENELAHSGATDYFDISSSFDDSWFSASGTPLDLYFFESDQAGTDLVSECGSFLDNGKCDLSFNILGFQYDGGDCCAATCSKPNCGQYGANGAFGVNETEGNGYRTCEDPDMVPVTFVLNKITSSRNRDALPDVTKEQEDEYFREKDINFWDQKPVTPYFIVDCEGKNLLSIYIEEEMEGNNETIMVTDGARCVVSVSNTTNFFEKWDNDPIWWVDYTIYHGTTRENVITSGDSGVEDTVSFHRIPECYFDKLEGSVEVSSAYSNYLESTLALDWLINDNSGNSKCDDDFLIERFALSAVNFAAPIKAGLDRESSNSSHAGFHNIMQYNDDSLWISLEQQCRWENIACEDGSVEILSVRSQDLYGTISSSIGLLTGLRRLDYDANDMFGTIPTEIGLLANLEGLDIDNQRLTGTIPTEFGMLVSMRELDLDKNQLTGTIPTEFGLMKSANEFDLIYNKLSGPIPTELGKLSRMKTLGFEGNRLSGSIPSEIGSMRILQGLHLKKNNIIGTIPIDLGDAYMMEDLWLGENFMTGTFPSQLGKLGRLLSLELYNNNFRGTIPTEIGLMTSLTVINLRGNSFTGAIPSEIGYLTDLQELRLEGNKFFGTIPLQITLLQRLRILTVDESIIGAIPGDIKTMDQCNLCEESDYSLAENQVKNDEAILYENGGYGIIVEYTCRTLLTEHWEYPKSLLSANACKTLRDICVTCGKGPYNDILSVGGDDDIFTLKGDDIVV